MNKKVMKLVSMITIVLCMVMTLSNICLATGQSGSGTASGTESETTTDLTTDFGSSATVNVSKIGEVGANIAAVIRNAGIVLAVIILMVLGIKYMMGSAQEKAEYKKTMIPYIVGAVLLFAAAGIAQMVISFAQGVA